MPNINVVVGELTNVVVVCLVVGELMNVVVSLVLGELSNVVEVSPLVVCVMAVVDEIFDKAVDIGDDRVAELNGNDVNGIVEIGSIGHPCTSTRILILSFHFRGMNRTHFAEIGQVSMFVTAVS